MNKKVTLGELLGARIVLAICIAVYYWCWARDGWENYFSSIQQCVAIFALMFFCLLAVRERKYKKETVDEMAAANLKRCDSICYKITMVLIVCIAFLSAILRFTISPGNNRIYADGRTGADSNYQNGNILLYGCKGNLKWRS